MWLSAFAIAAILAPAKAGNITYSFNTAVGPGSAAGFITTDGTIGTLGTANIVNWDITLNDGTNPLFTLEGPTSGNNSTDLLEGSDLTASATQLIFNFSGVDDGLFILENPSVGNDGPALCYTISGGCLGGPAGGVELVATAPEVTTVSTAMSGPQVIAGTASAPEPGSALLLLTGMVGIGLIRCQALFDRNLSYFATSLPISTGQRKVLASSQTPPAVFHKV
jgi:hypothetical protein